MKIGILDFVFPKGHHFFNNKIIELLSNDYETVIAENKNMKYRCNDVKKIATPDLNKFAIGKISARLVSAFYMLYQRVKIDKKVNNIVLLNFDIVVFTLLKWLYSKRSIYLFHHQYIDELKNSYKKAMFKTFMNDITHFVFADFMKDYLVNEIGVNSERVFVVPHPMNISEPRTKNSDNLSNSYYLGISQSNDNAWIQLIIEEQKKHKFLEDINGKMLLKSSKFEYYDESLNVENKFYTRNMYESLFENAKAVLLLFPDTYEYRMSGTLFDAFLYHKPILSTNISITRHYSKLYPNNIKTFNNVNELKQLIANEIKFSEDEFVRFCEDHSDKKVLSNIKIAFEKKRDKNE